MFWTLNPKTIKPFRLSYEHVIRDRAKEMDYQCWLTGRYVAEAISSCFSKKHKYPSEPYTTEHEEVKPLSDAERFEAYAISYNHMRVKSDKPS